MENKPINKTIVFDFKSNSSFQKKSDLNLSSIVSELSESFSRSDVEDMECYFDSSSRLNLFREESEIYYSYLKKDGFFFLPNNEYHNLRYIDSGDYVIVHSDSYSKSDFLSKVNEFKDMYNSVADVLESRLSVMDVDSAIKIHERINLNDEEDRYVVSHSDLFNYMNSTTKYESLRIQKSA